MPADAEFDPETEANRAHEKLRAIAFMLQQCHKGPHAWQSHTIEAIGMLVDEHCQTLKKCFDAVYVVGDPPTAG